MEKFFAVFGKVMLVLLVLGSLTFAGFYFGKQTKFIPKPEAVMTEGPSNNLQVIAPTPITTDTQKLVIIDAGVPKSAGLSFDLYSITTPDTWVANKTSQTAMDEKLTLTKNGYEISIFQAATGGALCLYPGDPSFEGPSSTYQVFTTLTTQDGRNLRRSGDQNGLAFTICQKSPDNSYQQPTSYGHISVKLPDNFSTEMVTEIDAILSSLKKI